MVVYICILFYGNLQACITLAVILQISIRSHSRQARAAYRTRSWHYNLPGIVEPRRPPSPNATSMKV